MGEMIGGVSRWQAARLTSAIERKNREAYGGKFKMSSTTIGQFFKLRNVDKRASVEANIARFGLGIFKAGKFDQKGFEKAWENEQKQVNDGMKVVNDFVHGSYDIKSSANAYVKDLNQLVQENRHVMTQSQVKQFNQMLVDIRELQGNLDLFIEQNLLRDDSMQINNDKEKLRVLQNVIQEIPKRIESFKTEVKQMAAKYQADLDDKCNDLQAKLDQCYGKMAEFEKSYYTELSKKCDRMTEEFKSLEELIKNETDLEKKTELQNELKTGREHLQVMQREIKLYNAKSDSLAGRLAQNPLNAIGDCIENLRKAKSGEDFEKSQDFQKVSDFFKEIENNDGKLNELFNSTVLKTEGVSPKAEASLTELKQYAQSLPQAKLDQLKAKQKECNKNFDEIFANHESTLKAFEILAEGDTNFQDALKGVREKLQQYKADNSENVDYAKEIGDFSKKLEQLKSGDSESVQDIAELSKQIDRHITSMGQMLSCVKNRMPSLLGLQGSAYGASSRQINAFKKAIKADMEKATAISTQHAQMTDCFKDAMDKLPASMQLPDNIQALYNDFAQASKSLQTGIQEISQQAKSVAGDFYDGAWNEFRTADIASNPGVIEQFAEARKTFKSKSEEIKNNSKNIETLQQACTDKLSALEAELLKTPAGCQVLMDAHKAQMDQSIDVFEKAVELAENKSNYTLTSGSCSPSNKPKVEALYKYAQQRKGASAPIKQSIDQAHSTNVTNLNTNNEDFLKSYEAFDQVYKKGKKELDEMFQGLESQYNSTGFDDENWQAFLIKARGLPSEES